MRTGKIKVMSRLLFIYIALTIITVAGMMLSNIFVSGFLSERLRLRAIALLAGNSIWLISVVCMTKYRLKEVLQYFGRAGGDSSGVTDYFVWDRLQRFPYELFWFVFLFGIIATTTFITFEAVLTEPTASPSLDYVKSTLFNATSYFAIALLYYTCTRFYFRSLLSVLDIGEEPNGRFSSIMVPVRLILHTTLLFGLLRLSWYVIYGEFSGRTINSGVIFSLIGIVFIVGTAALTLLTVVFLRELEALIDRIRSLMQGDKALLRVKVPVLSRYETGELALAFNELQSRIAQEYEQLDRELELAHNVQKRILPPDNHRIGPMEIAGACLPCKEVGGDLFDVVALEGKSFAVLIGDVAGKGMPASLIMSAVLMLFRTEVKKGGSSGELLTRLNQLLAGTLNDGIYVTLGLALFKPEQGKMIYASAGHLSPYLIRDHKTEMLAVCSLPIGVSHDEMYSDQTVELQVNDRFVFYTDGIVEAPTKDGDIVGFDAWENMLDRLPPELSLEEQRELLLQSLVSPDQSDNYGHGDDRTLVLVHWNGGDDES